MATDEVRTYYRTTQKIRGLFDRLMGNLRSADALAGRRRKVTQDAVVNALILWAHKGDPEEVAKVLEPYISEYEAAWQSGVLTEGEKAPAFGAVGVDPATGSPLKKPKEPKRAKSG